MLIRELFRMAGYVDEWKSMLKSNETLLKGNVLSRTFDVMRDCSRFRVPLRRMYHRRRRLRFGLGDGHSEFGANALRSKKQREQETSKRIRSQSVIGIPRQHKSNYGF